MLIQRQATVLVGQILVAVTSIASIIVVTRAMGAAAYGQVGMITAVVGVLIVATELGLSATLNRDIARLEQRPAQVALLQQVLVLKFLILAPLVGLFVVFAQPVLSITLGRPEMGTLLLFGLAALLATEVFQVFRVFMIGIGETGTSVAVEVSIAALRLIGFVLWPSLDQFDFFIIIAGAASLGTIAVVLIVRPRFQVSNLRLTAITTTVRSIWSTTSRMAGIKIVYAVWDRLPILLLSSYLSDTQVGQLTLAVRIAERFRGLGSAVSSVNLAHMSKRFSEANRSDAILEIRRDFLMLSYVGGAAVAVTLLLAAPIALAFGGAEFVGAAHYLSFTILISYCYLQLNWIGSGVLFPLDSIGGLLTFHLISKVGAALIVLTPWIQGASQTLLILIVAESCSVFFYTRRSHALGVDLSTRGVLVLYTLITALFAITVLDLPGDFV